MNIDKIIKESKDIKDVINEYHNKWEEKERAREEVSANATEHLDYLLSCIKDDKFSNQRAIDIDMLLYSSNQNYVEFADTYSYLFDALMAYARKNMLTFNNDDYEYWFVVKHQGRYYEFNELHGQGSHVSTRLLDDYEGPHFTLDQFQSGYEFDTTDAERLKMDMEFRDFLKERKNDGISEKVILEVMGKYLKEKRI